MRVVTFNVRHGESTAGTLDLGSLRRVCAGLDADVLALQEVDKWMRRSRWARIARQVARRTGMVHAYAPALRKGWFGEYGNALLVRGRLSDVELLALPRDSGEPRAALLATAEAAGLSVSVAATHLSVAVAERDRQLAHLVAALGRRPLPRLLLGDFNGVLGDIAALVEPAGLRLVDAGPTFPAAAPGKQIDHVAVAGLEVVSSSVPETQMSDHRPLVVELRPS